MNTDNITSKGITLNENGKLMQIEIYEKRIDQLTNNWNELEEWLWEELDEYVKNNPKETYSKFVVIRIEDVLNKMKEIKEGNNVSSRN